MMHAKNGKVSANGGEADYICFGKGSRDFIILPGASDGFRTVKGLALPMLLFYRQFTDKYRVWMFSRRDDLPEGFTTADMADDLAAALEVLQIPHADVLGVSQGGMIAQQLAVRHQKYIDKLVLAVTAPCANDMIREAVPQWIEWAKESNFTDIMRDTAERSYTGTHLEKSLKQNQRYSKLMKPKDFTRAIRILESTLTHDALERLPQIKAQTLILGAEKDRIVGAEASRELHKLIPQSECYIYPEYSHGVYEQAPDFYDRIQAFLADKDYAAG